MTINTKVICYRCHADLTESNNSINYRLKLKSERMPCHDGAVTDMLIMPQILEHMHFCGLGCLRMWFNEL